MNVTLEGAAAPQASSSPPPFAVVGCKSGARRQLLGSLRARTLRSAYPNRQPAQSPHTPGGRAVLSRTCPALSSEPLNARALSAHCIKCAFHQMHGPWHQAYAAVIHTTQMAQIPAEPLCPSHVCAHTPVALDEWLAASFFFSRGCMLVFCKIPLEAP